MTYIIQHPFKYYDSKVRLAAAVAGAFIMTIYGGGDESLFKLFWSWSIIPEFGSSLLITLVDVNIIFLVTRWLDRRYDWWQQPWLRLFLQTVFGVVAPALITFLLAAIYYALYGKNIIDANYHVYALPYITALIGIFNLYYLVRYLIAFVGHLLADLARQKELFIVSAARQQPPLTVKDITSGTMRPTPEPKSVFIVRTLTRNFPIAIEDIAYCYRSNGNVYLRPFEGGNHLLAQSLDAIEAQLEERHFFRVARHMLVHYKAIKGYQPLKDGKLGLVLDPDYGQEVTVSKPLARSFKQWMDR